MIRFFHIFMLLILAFLPFSSALRADSWQSKVDPWVLEQTTAGSTEFLVFLNEQADLSGVKSEWSKLEKGTYVFQKLSEVAERTQRPLLAVIEATSSQSQSPIEYRSFWVTNSIWVRGNAETVQTIASRSDVAHVFANPHVQLDQLEPSLSPLMPDEPQTIEANIQRVRAPLVWAEGITGQGAVIGGQDTGYDWDHPALKNSYRGSDGTTADHNYSWHDAIHSDDPHTGAGNPCGFNSPVPCDDQTHGTHTMGTMVGDDQLGHQIGMAPGARWIGCRNMEQGWGTPATYMECYQWFIAPTDLNNSNPRPDLAPDVINNSWGCPVVEGCTNPLILQATVENVRLAGIVTVHSAGNDGPACSTVNEPAAIYDASFSVGATDANDIIAYFSSRGPVTVDGSNRMKPDVSAPGTNILSSVPSQPGQNLYMTNQGTSMAAPHVAGLVALLIAAQPHLAGRVDRIEELIRHSTVPRTTSQICGGVPGSQVPNNTYGWGRIDAWDAYQNLPRLEISKTVIGNSYDPGQIITYTLQVSSYSSAPSANLVITDVIPANTSLLSASLPHSQIGDTIRWDLDQLDAFDSQWFKLVVQVSPTASGPIINQEYAVSNDQIGILFGEPVTLFPAIYYYLPLVFSQ